MIGRACTEPGFWRTSTSPETVARAPQAGAGDDAVAREFSPQEGDGVAPEAEARGAVVGDDASPLPHGYQRHGSLGQFRPGHILSRASAAVKSGSGTGVSPLIAQNA